MRDYSVLDIETSGLEPREEYITCVGIMDYAGIKQFTDTYGQFNINPETAERRLLEDWLHSSSGFDSKTIMTYNGRKFDIPFLLTRLEYHGLNTDFGKFRHIDLFNFVNAEVKRFVGKDEAAFRLMNIYVPRSPKGAYFARAYRYKQVTHDIHLDMLEHNAIDLVTTQKMHNYLSPYPDYDAFVENEMNRE